MGQKLIGKDLNKISPRNGVGLLVTTATANIQCHLKSGYYGHSSINTGGYTCGVNEQIEAFDVAVGLPELSEDKFKQGFLAIVKEIVYNQLGSYSGLINDLKEKGILPKSAFDTLTFSDFLKYAASPNSAVLAKPDESIPAPSQPAPSFKMVREGRENE